MGTRWHRGSDAELGAAHDAVHAWCARQGHRLSRTRWERYGPHRDNPDEVWTEISWLLVTD